jgi:hypothetical protein
VREDAHQVDPSRATVLAQLISDDCADRLAVMPVIRHVAARAAQVHRARPTTAVLPKIAMTVEL